MLFPVTESIRYMDKHVAIAVRDVGTKVHALIGKTDYEVSAAQFRDYAVQAVQRFGPRGSFWAENPGLNRKLAPTVFELMNEPWFRGDSIKYAKYIKPTLVALKKLGGGVKVIVVTVNRYKKTGMKWFNGLYKVIPNLNKYIAGFATHPYYNGFAPNEIKKKLSEKRSFSCLDSLRAMMNCRGASKKGIYVTEYGSSTSIVQGTSEALQAKYLSVFLKATTQNTYGWGVVEVLVFQLLDWGPEFDNRPENREAHFGIARPDGSPKPAWPVVKKYMKAINAPTRKPKPSIKGMKPSQVLGFCKKH